MLLLVYVKVLFVVEVMVFVQMMKMVVQGVIKAVVVDYMMFFVEKEVTVVD